MLEEYTLPGQETCEWWICPIIHANDINSYQVANVLDIEYPLLDILSKLIDTIPFWQIDTHSKETFDMCHDFMMKTMLSKSEDVIIMRKKIERLLADSLERDNLVTNWKTFSPITHPIGKVFNVSPEPFIHNDGSAVPLGSLVLIWFVWKPKVMT